MFPQVNNSNNVQIDDKAARETLPLYKFRILIKKKYTIKFYFWYNIEKCEKNYL